MDTVYIYLWKRIDKILTHFGDALCKKYFFLSHVVFNLTMECTPRGMDKKSTEKWWSRSIVWTVDKRIL